MGRLTKHELYLQSLMILGRLFPHTIPCDYLHTTPHLSTPSPSTSIALLKVVKNTSITSTISWGNKCTKLHICASDLSRCCAPPASYTYIFISNFAYTRIVIAVCVLPFHLWFIFRSFLWLLLAVALSSHSSRLFHMTLSTSFSIVIVVIT